MTAQVIAIKQPSLNALIEQTKAAWARSEQYRADADEWQVRTGRLLIELKTRVKQEGGRWLVVLKRLGRSQRRAHELMQSAVGDVTVEQQRTRVRKAVKKSRARKKKSALRNADKGGPQATPVEDDLDQTIEEQWQNSLSNLCGDILSRRAYWDKHIKGWREFECPSHLKRLVREAAMEFSALTAAVTMR